MTVNLLICFTIDPMNIENTWLLFCSVLIWTFFIPSFSLRSNNWKICPKYTCHQESSLPLNLNRNLKKKPVRKNPKKKLFQAWIPSQEKLTNWWRYLKLHDFATSYVLSILSLACFFFFFISVWPGALYLMNEDEFKRKEIIWDRLCHDVKLTQF